MRGGEGEWGWSGGGRGGGRRGCGVGEVCYYPTSPKTPSCLIALLIPGFNRGVIGLCILHEECTVDPARLAYHAAYKVEY